METRVRCNNGTFVGKKVDELIIWKGIPYATQPVGKLRWQKALPAKDDDGVYGAKEPGHVPIGPFSDTAGTAEFGEDCLLLNVYCNTSCTDDKKPVMVWIHGGRFCAESQASPLYDLTNIARQYPDILFISIDYQVGFMGFMNFERVPGGENFKEAGNLGLLNQLEALRWVQINIAGFGGDPDNVTIFGESAGSASTTFLPLLDGSEGSRLEQYCNDINFRAGNTDIAMRHSAAGGNTYMYFVKKPVLTPELGSIHAAEVPYLFDTRVRDPMGSGKVVGTDECEFRHVAKEMWANFARTGNPSTDKYEWKKVLGGRPPDDGLRRCHRHAEGPVRKAGGPHDVLGRAPWERIVQEGLLTRARGLRGMHGQGCGAIATSMP